MELVSNPALPPACCFLCNGKPPGAQWIDSLSTFEPGGYTSLNGRKYVCSVCVDTMARLLGFETGTQVTEAQEKEEIWRRRYYALNNRLYNLVDGLADLARDDTPETGVKDEPPKRPRGRPKKVVDGV